MKMRSEYLFDLTADGLVINGMQCGVTPRPGQIIEGLGKPSRILHVKAAVAAGREIWVFDELGVAALVEDNGATLHDICIYFETGYERLPEFAEGMPKQCFSGTIRLGQYRLRRGISFAAAMQVEDVRLNGFRIVTSEHENRVATCAIAVPLLS